VSIKVILRADVSGLGKRGDIVEVKDGFGRNYLLPRSLAIAATPGAVGQAQAMRRARDLRDAQDREAAQEIARTLVSRTITIKAKAGTEGRLFGSVTASDIVEAIADQTTIQLEKRQVRLEPIKTTGSHSVAIKLHADVEFPVSLEITPK
jgi:large subunit ribosomal protein L9